MLDSTVSLPHLAGVDAAPPAAYTPLHASYPATGSGTPVQQPTRSSQILEASLQVSIQAGHEGLALLYRTAIHDINTALAPDLGPDAIAHAAAQDNTPQGTAGRIVALSTAMFDTFAARYPDKKLSEVAEDFVKVLRGGFVQGYQEAEDILNRLGVLPDVTPVAQSLAKTYELVQQGYDDWLSHQRAAVPVDAGVNPDHPPNMAAVSADATVSAAS